MLSEIGDRMKTGMQLRMVAGITIGICVMFYFGAKESYRCVRTLFGPATVSYSEVTAKGLASYGYVKVTGVSPRVVEAIGMIDKKSGTTKAVYVPVDGEPAETVMGKGRLLLWLTDATSVNDAIELQDETEVTGFVDTNLEYHHTSADTQRLRTMARGTVEDSWVLEVRKPSWLKAIGLGGGAILIVAGLIVYLMKKPLEP